MKTVFRFFILIFSTATITWSNPIDATPHLKFSELAFDENNNWIMELVLPYPYYSSRIDSVILEVSDVRARLNIHFEQNTFLYVITSDSLSKPLSITPDGCGITIYTYSHPGTGTKKDYTIFGKKQGAYIRKPLPGYSLCKIIMGTNPYSPYFLIISPKPTLGFANDLDSLKKRMKGNIYDKDNKLVTGYKILYSMPYYYFEHHNPFSINPDGTYSTTIYPELYFPDSLAIGWLTVKIPNFGSWQQTQKIEPIYFAYNMSDTVIIRDIHLKSNDYILTGVEKAELPKNSELTLINYPNPFNSSTNFFVKLPDNMKEKQGDIKIYNPAGQLISTIPAVSGSTSYWDGKDMNGSVMSSGIYYYQLNVNNDKLKSGSMILLK